MAVDTTDLEIRVRSLEVDAARRRLDRLENSSGRAERATDKLGGAFKGLLAPLAALVSITALASKLVTVQREFDVLNAGLVTATKSTENAGKAFEALQEFAQNTPYGLKQAVVGFNQLVNLGLTPSEKAMMSYGNTASAMGKDLSQMIEAVADATTGEFERLKEFGIKSKNEGDQITFTFQGVKTSVKNNAAEIEKYLIALGENQFAGAMQKRMDTLDGSIANLEDNWDSLFRNISAAGVGDLIREQVDLAAGALDELNTMIVSGEMEAYLVGYAQSWAVWADDVIKSVDLLDGYLTTLWPKWREDATGAARGMYLGFKEFPSEVRAYFQEAGVDVANFVLNVQNQARYISEAFDNLLTDPMGKQAEANYQARDKSAREVYANSMAQIAAEKKANQDALNASLEAGAKIREEYDKQLAAKRALSGDRLAQYKVSGDPASEGADALSPAEQKKAEAKAKQLRKEFDDLVASLNTEEESIAASYEKRREIIERNTSAESATRAGLMARLDKNHKQELDQLHGIEEAYEKRKRLAKEVQDIEESGWDARTRAAAAYQRQMETLWQAQLAGVLNEEQHEEAVKKVTLAYEVQQDKSKTGFMDMEEFGKQAARNMQDAFADFLFDPFAEGIDGMLLGFVKVVQRMAAEAAAAQLASKLFGSAGGGEGSGWLGTLLSVGASMAGSYFGGGGGGALSSASTSGASAGASGFASGFDASAGNVSFPGRAAGGPTNAGQMYEVSERGPELYKSNGRTFLLDGQAGSVTPTSAASSGSSGGAPQINVDITVMVNADGTTSETSNTNDDRADATQLGDQLKGIAVSVIQDEMRPGGLIWNMTENRNG